MEVNNCIPVSQVGPIEGVHYSNEQSPSDIKRIGNAALTALKFLVKNADLIAGAAAIVATAVLMPVVGPEILVITLPILGLVALYRILSSIDKTNRQEQIETCTKWHNTFEEQKSSLNYAKIKGELENASNYEDLIFCMQSINRHIHGTCRELSRYDNDFRFKLIEEDGLRLGKQIDRASKNKNADVLFATFQNRALSTLDNYNMNLTNELHGLSKLVQRLNSA